MSTVNIVQNIVQKVQMKFFKSPIRIILTQFMLYVKVIKI